MPHVQAPPPLPHVQAPPAAAPNPLAAAANPLLGEVVGLLAAGRFTSDSSSGSSGPGRFSAGAVVSGMMWCWPDATRPPRAAPLMSDAPLLRGSIQKEK